MAQELLKEAIADAKAVREVALQNAKMALEEAFDSKIKNMLSAKLAEELEEDVELEDLYEEEDEEKVEETYDNDEDDAMEEDFDLDEEIDLDELMAELEMNETDDNDEDDLKEGELVGAMISNADQIALAAALGLPVASLAAMGVEKLIKKAAAKFGKKSADAGKEKATNEDFDFELEEDFDLNEGELVGAMVSNADQIALAAALGLPAASLAAMGVEKLVKKIATKFGKKSADAGKEKATNEDFDIDALIAEIEAELEEGDDKEELEERRRRKKKEDEEEALDEARRRAKRAEDEKKAKEKELDEALSTVASLRESISEMNLLNSKLLYCNKLFRANSLTENQKIKVVDALDKATTAGEAKLVYETLQESFAFTGVEKRAIQEGLARASKPVGNAPKKVITESVDDTVSRFQKLANIKF